MSANVEAENEIDANVQQNEMSRDDGTSWIVDHDRTAIFESGNGFAKAFLPKRRRARRIDGARASTRPGKMFNAR